MTGNLPIRRPPSTSIKTGSEIQQEIAAPFSLLQELMPFKSCVVSTGGGAVERRKNWGYMQHGVVIWLDGSPELLARRTCNDGQNSRPMLGNVEEVKPKLIQSASQ